jgi:hypothetical protein
MIRVDRPPILLREGGMIERNYSYSNGVRSVWRRTSKARNSSRSAAPEHGLQTAENVIEKGGSAVTIGRPGQKLDDAVASLSRLGGAWSIAADLTNWQLTHNHSDALLVNSAGFFLPKPFIERFPTGRLENAQCVASRPGARLVWDAHPGCGPRLTPPEVRCVVSTSGRATATLAGESGGRLLGHCGTGLLHA